MNDNYGSSGYDETDHWTLFGDPSLELRTDQPSALSVSHDGAIVVGQSELVVNTGVDNALVAISKDNELLTYGYSENGSANINLENIDLLPGDYDLVVTSFNAFPYENTVSVITRKKIGEGKYGISENAAFEVAEVVEQEECEFVVINSHLKTCLLYTSPSPRDRG